MRLSEYAKTLSKDDKISSLSNFLETNKFESVFTKKLVVRDNDQSIQKLKSIRISENNRSKSLFQNQNILLEKVKWEKGKLSVLNNGLAIEGESEILCVVSNNSPILF